MWSGDNWLAHAPGWGMQVSLLQMVWSGFGDRWWTASSAYIGFPARPISPFSSSMLDRWDPVTVKECAEAGSEGSFLSMLNAEFLCLLGPYRWRRPQSPAILSQQQTKQWRCDCHGNPASPPPAGEACWWTEGRTGAWPSFHPYSTLEGYVLKRNKHPHRFFTLHLKVSLLMFFTGTRFRVLAGQDIWYTCIPLLLLL